MYRSNEEEAGLQGKALNFNRYFMASPHGYEALAMTLLRDPEQKK